MVIELLNTVNGANAIYAALSCWTWTICIAKILTTSYGFLFIFAEFVHS